jgi:general secretion pathway protein D
MVGLQWFLLLQLVLILSHPLRASDLVDQSFLDFVRFVSNTSKTNIVVDESVDSRFSIVLPNDYQSLDSLDLFYSVLDKNNLEPAIIGSTMYIKKRSDNQKFYSIDLFFELPEPISKAIISNYPDIKVSTIQKTVAFKTDSKKYNEIKSLVEVLDRPRPQRKLKIIMISYNDSDIKEYGAKLSFQHSGSSNIGLSSVINSLVLGNTFTFLNDKTNLSLSFSALNSAGVAKIYLDNIVSLSDGKDSTVRATKTIPYLSQENNVDGTQNVSTNSYQYKDVGTEIMLSNVTVTEDTLYFQATFKYEQLINDSITPTTSKREVINYLRIPAGSSMLISGIRSYDDSNNKAKIPLLGDIPYFGSIFRYDTTNHKEETFAIYLENVGFDDKNVTGGYSR